MGLASLLPGFLQGLARKGVNKDFSAIEKILTPVIAARRTNPRMNEKLPDFLPFILQSVDDDVQAADVAAIIVWGGLTNLQSTFSSTLLDIISKEGLQDAISASLAGADVGNLDAWVPTAPWKALRSAMFESIRLAGPITGPGRLTNETITLASDPQLKLPKNQVATLSAYHTHRDKELWGADAGVYLPRRFIGRDPPVGDVKYITWGLKGPHCCPGRWFGQVAIQIMVKVLLDSYKFKPDARFADDKYTYKAGSVLRKPMLRRSLHRQAKRRGAGRKVSVTRA